MNFVNEPREELREIEIRCADDVSCIYAGYWWGSWSQRPVERDKNDPGRPEVFAAFVWRRLKSRLEVLDEDLPDLSWDFNHG